MHGLQGMQAAVHHNGLAMEYMVMALLGAGTALFFKRQAQRKRVELLAGLLRRHQIEKLMEQLVEGYPRAAGEADAARSRQVFALLEPVEHNLCSQFDQFASEFAQVDDAEAHAGISDFGIPALAAVLPAQGFDARKMFQVHAQGLRAASLHQPHDTLQQRKQQAYTMSAELLLMQHTCHWYCRSRNMASARLALRHQTSHEQVLQAVSPATRSAYARLIQER